MSKIKVGRIYKCNDKKEYWLYGKHILVHSIGVAKYKKYNAYNVDALCIETSENVYCCIVGNSSSGTKGNIDLWEPVDANIAE